MARAVDRGAGRGPPVHGGPRRQAGLARGGGVVRGGGGMAAVPRLAVVALQCTGGRAEGTIMLVLARRARCTHLRG